MKYHLTKTICSPIKDKTEIQLVATELKTHLKNDPHAIALAAPQIGYNVKMFIVRPGLVYINPEYIHMTSEMNTDVEGCRSLPNVGLVEVRRYNSITIQYEDVNGNLHIATFADYKARVIQHEMDHLYGLMIG